MSRLFLALAAIFFFPFGLLSVHAAPLRGERLKAEARKQLDQKNWGGLMRLYEEARKVPLDPTVQAHPLRNFYQGLLETGEESGPSEETRMALEAWAAAMPDAAVPTIALASWHVDKAWAARGSSYANAVTPEGWAGMHDHLATAESLLQNIANPDDRDVFYYDTSMTVSLGQQNTIRLAEQFQEGMRQHPGANMLQVNRAYSLLPRWFGREGEWLAFVRSEANKLSGDAKDMFFAEVFSTLVIYDEPQMENLTPEEVSMVIRGLELQAAHRYPEGWHLSQGILNRLARFAIAQDQPEVARRAFLGGVGGYSRTSWYSLENYRKAQESSGAQAFKKEMQELERAGKLDECEKRWKEVSIYPFPNPNLQQFYRRNGLEERVQDSRLVWDRSKNPEEAPVMEAFAGARGELMRANWELAEAYGRRFDSIRPHNLTGKIAILAAAIGQEDPDKLETIRKAILEMESNRGNYLLAIDFVAGKKTWEEIQSELEPNSHYGQATLLMALAAIAQGDKPTALEIARTVSEHPTIGGTDSSVGLESIYQGNLYRAFQLASE